MPPGMNTLASQASASQALALPKMKTSFTWAGLIRASGLIGAEAALAWLAPGIGNLGQCCAQPDPFPPLPLMGLGSAGFFSAYGSWPCVTSG